MGIEINNKLEKYKKYVKQNVNTKRYIHSLGVSYTAAALAMRYNCDVYNAQVAGILHDCAKGLSNDDIIKECIANKIEITSIELASPELLHSKLGAYIAKNVLGVDNEEIINAVFYHTTGRPAMSLLEKIIFVSDYIEPHRTNLPYLDEIRFLSFTNIDHAITKICEGSIQYLKKKGANIDETTICTYDYYKEIVNGSK